MALKIRLILSFILALVSGVSLSQEFRYRNFSIEDGLPQDYVYAICQDSLGFLWIGTGEGLANYNGFELRKYTTSDSLPSNFITCSLKCGKEIWFGHENGSVSCYDGESFHKIRLSGNPVDRITGLSLSAGNNVWAATSFSGLFRLDRELMVFNEVPFPGLTDLTSICNMSNNRIIAGTNSGLKIITIDYSGSVFSVLDVPGIPLSGISAVKKAKNSEAFIIATKNDGIYSIRPWQDKIIVNKITDSEKVTGVQDLCEDNDSVLWIATYGNGLVRVAHDSASVNIKCMNTSSGFASDNVRTVFKDREGNIWSGNFGKGLTLVTPEAFSFLDPDPEHPGNSVFAILHDGKSTWLGTGEGLLRVQAGRIISSYSGLNGLPRDTVTSLYKDPEGDLWIGTGRSGVFRLHRLTGKLIKCTITQAGMGSSVTMITGKGNLIYAGTKKGLCIYDRSNGSISYYSINRGLPHNWINCVYPETSGKVWISTKSKMLAYLQDGKIVKVPAITGPGVIAPGPVTSAADSGIWIGTAGNGIFIIKNDTVINLTMREGLASDYCYTLAFDGKYMWAVHRSSLSRIAPSDLSVRPMRRFGDAVFNYNSVGVNGPGRICFGTSQGVLAYDATVDAEKPVPPIPVITSVRVNEKEISPEDGVITLSPGKYRIRIDYAGCSLKEPEIVRYRTILDGFDEGWSESTVNRSATWNNVSYGSYSFLLRASGADGITGVNPLKLDIVIRKPFWKFWWFYPVLAFILTAMIYYYITIREKRLREEKRILEEKVSERTQELEMSMNEIEQQRDEINEKNLNITSSIQYARQIQKALLPPLEILDRAISDSFIMHQPKDIVSGDFYWIAERDNKIIFTVADCTGHGVPGAFMSLLGITLLNEIVNVHGIIRSEEIVNELRRRVILSLRQNQDGVTTRDGMDISLCVLDKKTRILHFTGAMNDMVLIRNGKLHILKANHLDVSISYNDFGDFTYSEIECLKGDMLYLFTDGYQDQFGGEFEKKFLRPHFYTTLVEVHKLPMLNQKEKLEKKLSDWMRHHQQTDDITIMGIRIQ